MVVDTAAMINKATEGLETEVKEAGVDHKPQQPTAILVIRLVVTVRLEVTVHNPAAVLLQLPIRWEVAVQAIAHMNSHTTVGVDTMKIQDLVVMVILGLMEVKIWHLIYI